MMQLVHFYIKIIWFWNNGRVAFFFGGGAGGEVVLRCNTKPV